MNTIRNIFKGINLKYPKYTIINKLLRIRIMYYREQDNFDTRQLYDVLEKNKNLNGIKFLFDESKDVEGNIDISTSTPATQFLERLYMYSNIKKLTFGNRIQYDNFALDLNIKLSPYITHLNLTDWNGFGPVIDFTENGVLEEIMINADHPYFIIHHTVDLSTIYSLQTIKIDIGQSCTKIMPELKNTIINKFKLPYGCIMTVK